VIQPPVVLPPIAAVKGLRGLENAGKPGHYTVQRGDTLVRIALDHGQNWRDLARWNGLDNPNLIEVGEVLRVTAPTEPQPPRPVAAQAAEPPPRQASVAAVPAAPSVQAGSAAPLAPPASSDELNWIWPAQGQTVILFDEVKNKGLDIAARAGDPVLAAADGRVVYAGAGLRGYGNLIIVKHNNTYLTAYAHNQALLVKEDQMVKQGQKIAEMGSSDADRVKLHFEIRRQGKPVDPLRYLPPR
jgi:lipoprotein NlpD